MAKITAASSHEQLSGFRVSSARFIQVKRVRPIALVSESLHPFVSGLNETAYVQE